MSIREGLTVCSAQGSPTTGLVKRTVTGGGAVTGGETGGTAGTSAGPGHTVGGEDEDGADTGGDRTDGGSGQELCVACTTGVVGAASTRGSTETGAVDVTTPECSQSFEAVV